MCNNLLGISANSIISYLFYTGLILQCLYMYRCVDSSYAVTLAIGTVSQQSVVKVTFVSTYTTYIPGIYVPMYIVLCSHP